MTTYSHRNGEALQPVIAGFYWIEGDEDDNYPTPNVLSTYIAELNWTGNRREDMRLTWSIGEHQHTVSTKAKFHGPIPKPGG